MTLKLFGGRRNKIFLLKAPFLHWLGAFLFGVPMKTAFSLLALAMILSACAGNSSEQIPTINGDNNTITINQTPSVDKASKTDIDAAGSGYGSVTR